MKRFIVIISLLAFCSCDEFLKEKPMDFLSAESEAVDEAFVEAQLQGAFKALLWYKNGRQGFIGISGTDEAQGKTVEVNYWADQGGMDRYNASLNSDNYLPKWYWDSGYFGIARANNTINAARKLTTLSETEIANIEAQARYVRAMNYFMLAQHFGKIPLITDETKPSPRPNYPREDLDKIYEFIEQDLIFAENNMTTTYRSGRPTVGAAKAMLMKTYMYAQPESGYRDYKKAKDKFEEIEKLGVYILQPSYAELFDPAFENGTESVYEFQFAYPDEPNHFQYFSGSRAIGEDPTGEGGGYAIYLPTQRYLDLFEAGDGDERFEASVRTRFYLNGQEVTSAGDPEYLAPHCKKYEDPNNARPWNSSKNIYYIRYADLILLYAECLNDEGDLAGAVKQVERIRDRAGAVKPITATDKASMLDYIYEERMRELGMEGWRRLDLARRGADYFAEQVSLHNEHARGNVKPYHALYPIPANEISINEGIGQEDQNPGYN